jgi:hypothetical protein
MEGGAARALWFYAHKSLLLRPLGGLGHHAVLKSGGSAVHVLDVTLKGGDAGSGVFTCGAKNEDREIGELRSVDTFLRDPTRRGEGAVGAWKSSRSLVEVHVSSDGPQEPLRVVVFVAGHVMMLSAQSSRAEAPRVRSPFHPAWAVRSRSVAPTSERAKVSWLTSHAPTSPESFWELPV